MGQGRSGRFGIVRLLADRDGIRRRVRWFAQPVTYLGVAMLAFIGCVLALLIAHERDEAYQSHVRRGGNLVRIIEQSFSHMFKRVDASVLLLRKSFEQDPAAFDLEAWTRNTSLINELTIDFTITGANGRIRVSTLAPDAVGGDLSDRESFIFHARSSEDRLFISGPMFTKVSKVWAVVMSRRLSNPDGSFAGMIAALVDPSQLATQVGTVDLGPRGSISLAGYDGIVRTRIVDGMVSYGDFGRSLPPNTNLMKHAANARSGHFWNTPNIIDDVTRLVSFRALESLPLVALVSASEAEDKVSSVLMSRKSF